MILNILKEQTQEAHIEAERDNLAKYIIDGSIDQITYERLLRQNFRIYKAVEDFINSRYDNLPNVLKPFAGYHKTNNLANDISGFSNLPLPQPTPLAGSRSLATIVGMMYVIEGSMVGGMMISNKLKSCAQLSHIDKHHFFNNDVKSSTKRWKEFKVAVNTLTFDQDAIQEAVKSAINTFELFQKAYKMETI